MRRAQNQVSRPLIPRKAFHSTEARVARVLGAPPTGTGLTMRVIPATDSPRNEHSTRSRDKCSISSFSVAENCGTAV